MLFGGGGRGGGGGGWLIFLIPSFQANYHSGAGFVLAVCASSSHTSPSTLFLAEEMTLPRHESFGRACPAAMRPTRSVGATPYRTCLFDVKETQAYLLTLANAATESQ